MHRRRKAHARVAVGRGHRLDGAVGQDGADARVYTCEEPLRLAEGVAEEQRHAAGVAVGSPPRVDRAENLGLTGPPVDGKAEGRFGDEGMAADRLERRAGRIGIGLVVTGDDPDLATVLEPDLRRAEDVAGRMQRQPHPAEIDRRPVVEGVDGGGAAESAQQHLPAGRGGQIAGAAPGHVIAVRVRDDRAVDRCPGVDVEITGLAVEPA